MCDSRRPEAGADSEPLLSDFDRENIGEVLRTGTWFTAHLLRLVQKADVGNRRCFPHEVAAFEAWLDGQA